MTLAVGVAAGGGGGCGGTGGGGGGGIRGGRAVTMSVGRCAPPPVVVVALVERHVERALSGGCACGWAGMPTSACTMPRSACYNLLTTRSEI